MSAQTTLERLGYAPDDRLVIIHVDDVGMCQATLTAFDDLWHRGCITSGSVMVPCPWFSSVAKYCQEHPDVDMGVHATLTCEWSAYRWGPLSTIDPASGLLDAEGYFPRTAEAVIKNANPSAVKAELAAQIEKAQQAGISLTHVDSHMGTVFAPHFLMDYLTLSLQNGLPAMQPRADAVGVDGMGVTEKERAQLIPALEQVEGHGLPLMDGIMMMPLDQPEGQLEIAKQLFSQVPVGITHFIIHPAVDTPELRAICPDWPSRVANYETFMDPAIKAFIEAEGIRLIGFRELRDRMRTV